MPTLINCLHEPAHLASRLANTEGELVEYNTWGDRFWGVYLGVGKNHLGCLLMETRALLQR